VSDAIIDNPNFLISTGLGAASTVFIATVIGMPISTTHSLAGALFGAGLASGTQVNLYTIGNR
jgi:PiT family inorganic phosphate transporter